MKRYSAHYIFPINQAPIKNGIIEVDDDGTILKVYHNNNQISEIEGLEFHNGIICPGFVNAHCHLELSHLKDKISQKKGLPEFLKGILLQRDKTDEDFQLFAARQADRFMNNNGIVAVGDVSNSSMSLEIKENSSIYYHTFIECFGFIPERAPRSIEYANFIQRLFKTRKLKSSIVPHAPYSVSNELFVLIKNQVKNHDILSIHHQESAEEDRMFLNRRGGLIDHLQNNLKFNIDFWQVPNQSATKFLIGKLSASVKTLFVHNTFIDKAGINCIIEKLGLDRSYFVTCPNANLYIENRLPDYQLWINSNLNICIGTDSLASNNKLSILEEIKTIQQHTDIDLNTLLQWSTINGAKALGIADKFGTLEIGKKPGLNLITGINYITWNLGTHSKVQKLIKKSGTL